MASCAGISASADAVKPPSIKPRIPRHWIGSDIKQEHPCRPHVCSRWECSDGSSKKKGTPGCVVPPRELTRREVAQLKLRLYPNADGRTRGSLLHRVRPSRGDEAPPNDSWTEVIRFAQEKEGINGYGLWFYRARGSGIWVNVGKTIGTTTKEALLGKASPPCHRPIEDAQPGAPFDLLSKWLRWHNLLGFDRSVALYTRGEQTIALPEQALPLLQRGGAVLGGGERFPFMAYQLGLDSVQLAKDRELIITSPTAMSAGSSLTACTSLDTRTGWNASQVCICVGDGELTLNCDNRDVRARTSLPVPVPVESLSRRSIGGVVTASRPPFRMAPVQRELSSSSPSQRAWEQLAWTHVNLSWSSEEWTDLDRKWTWAVRLPSAASFQAILQSTWSGRWPLNSETKQQRTTKVSG